eukprot:Trichotokara_eunicae@DN5557_c0_g1_i1.p1
MGKPPTASDHVIATFSAIVLIILSPIFIVGLILKGIGSLLLLPATLILRNTLNSFVRTLYKTNLGKIHIYSMMIFQKIFEGKPHSRPLRVDMEYLKFYKKKKKKKK